MGEHRVLDGAEQGCDQRPIPLRHRLARLPPLPFTEQRLIGRELLPRVTSHGSDRGRLRPAAGFAFSHNPARPAGTVVVHTSSITHLGPPPSSDNPLVTPGTTTSYVMRVRHA